ncbi:MAG TPA: MYXO-CTERM sorting domain-containing protein, partial [Archangium sp.]|uniref:MYXO-CTERM sorting domain-containing protein n=1 Tax=Archangium sp. TaxID=1872627 RepID=UPI002ED9F8D1
TDSLQRVYLGGYTTSSGLRADGGFDTALEDNSQGDGFVARMRLEPEPAFEWFSYVGGSGKDGVLTLHVDHRDPNRLYIGGDTTSQDLRYADAGFDTSANGAFRNNMFLMAVDLNATPGGGATPDGGGGGTNLEMEPLSPLGWSCGASGTSGGAGAFALGTLAGLGLLVFRRKRTLRS